MVSSKDKTYKFQSFCTVQILYCSRHKGSFVFKYLCKYCIVLNTKGLLVAMRTYLFQSSGKYVNKAIISYISFVRFAASKKKIN